MMIVSTFRGYLMENLKNEWLESIAMFNWLANIFYQIPTIEKLTLINDNLTEWPVFSKDLQTIVCTILTSIKNDGQLKISRDFHHLFVGPGKKEVYPWGSVYTDEDALLFGHSTMVWKAFCSEYHIDIKPECNEPTDHFALFFSALAAMMKSKYSDTEKSRIVNLILQDHFHPWGLTVLKLIQQKAQTDYFKGFAFLAHNLIEYWVQKNARSQQ